MTTVRQPPKQLKTLQQYKEEALSRFLSEGKSKRKDLFHRFRQGRVAADDVVLKSWMLGGESPAVSSPVSTISQKVDGETCRPSIADHLQWEDFLCSDHYQDLLLQMEEALYEEMANEELMQGCDFEDESFMDCDEAQDPEAVLCPLCLQHYLSWNADVKQLSCPCGGCFDLSQRGWTPTDFRSALAEVFDR
eukprot:scaffold7439_cov168-Ochromonas_danica.AAC.8